MSEGKTQVGRAKPGDTFYHNGFLTPDGLVPLFRYKFKVVAVRDDHQAYFGTWNDSRRKDGWLDFQKAARDYYIAEPWRVEPGFIRRLIKKLRVLVLDESVNTKEAK